MVQKILFVSFALIAVSFAHYGNLPSEEENQIDPGFQPPTEPIFQKPVVAQQYRPKYITRPAPQFAVPNNYPTYVKRPQYVQVSRPNYQYVQPQYVQPQYVQPQYVQQYVQPQYVQTHHVQQQYVQPQYVQTHHVQPQYVQTQHVQPQIVSQIVVPQTVQTVVPQTVVPQVHVVPQEVTPVQPVHVSYPTFKDPPKPIFDENEEDIQPAFQEPAPTVPPTLRPVQARRPTTPYYPEVQKPIVDENEEDIQPAFQLPTTPRPVQPARQPEDRYIVNYENSFKPKVTEQEVAVQNQFKKPIDRY